MLVGLCLGGDVQAMKLILDRGWPVKLELTGDAEIALRVIDHSDGRAQPPGFIDAIELAPEPATASIPAAPAPPPAPEPTPPAPPPPAPPAVHVIQRPWLDRGPVQIQAD